MFYQLYLKIFERQVLKHMIRWPSKYNPSWFEDSHNLDSWLSLLENETVLS